MPWLLQPGPDGTAEDLLLAPAPRAAAPLKAGQLRVAVRAAGVNFRDVLITLGMYPGDAEIGGEGAGVVLETGPGVTGLAPGDRVMGLMNGFGPVAVTDKRLVVPVPDGWSWAEAAAVPVAFLTAYYGLVAAAGARAGERLLVHSAAGGVGMAAVQLARHLGLEVFGTASPAKWPVLAAQGLDAAHTASSRTLEFAERFRAATPARGVDIVLNALAGPFTDASLGLLAPGGRLVEMGKTDVRDPARVAADYPGAAYQVIDLQQVAPDAIAGMLAELAALFAAGKLHPLPVRCWDIRRAREAFRFVSQARHTGKVVLSIPRSWDPDGTVLVTGGTGTLGAELARHLADTGTRRLLLASRRGPAAPGAVALAAALAADGAAVTITACDVTSQAQLAAVIDAVPPQAPLTAVVHTAAALDDGVVTALTPQRIDTVMAPKAGAAWQLHELTAAPGPGRVRAVLLGGGHVRDPRAGQLRRGQRLPRRAGGRPPRGRAARCLPRLGPVGAAQRTDRPPDRPRHRPHGTSRAEADRYRAGTGPVRRGRWPGRAADRAGPDRHHRPDGSRPAAAVQPDSATRQPHPPRPRHRRPGHRVGRLRPGPRARRAVPRRAAGTPADPGPHPGRGRARPPRARGH